MVSRRQVLARGGTGIAVLGLGLPSSQVLAGQALGGQALAASVSPSPSDIGLFVIDQSILGADGAANAMQAARIETAFYSGDIGTPWLSHIEPLWRTKPQAIAGLTFGGAFFCLEHLARTYGLTCTFRSPPSEPGQVRPTGSLEAEGMAASVMRAMAAPNFAQAGLGTPLVEENKPLIWRLQPKVSHHPKPTDRG